MTILLTTCMVEVLLQNLTVVIPGRVRHERTERDLVMTLPMEVIQMEAMIQSTLRAKSPVAKRIRSLFHLFQQWLTWKVGCPSALPTFLVHVRILTKRSG